MDTDRITRSNRTHLQQTLTTQNLQIANCSCRQATHKRPACFTNMIGGRRTLQTYIATIKHDYLLFEDSIVSLSRRENTMTTDYLYSSSSCTKQNQASQPPPLCNINNMEHQIPLTQHSTAQLQQHQPRCILGNL